MITDNRLTNNDVKCMKLLSKYTNVIPLVGRADTYKESELKELQKSVRNDIDTAGIPVMELPCPRKELPDLVYEYAVPYPVLGETRSYPWSKGAICRPADVCYSATTLIK